MVRSGAPKTAVLERYRTFLRSSHTTRLFDVVSCCAVRYSFAERVN
jgi:hypothetical protein